MSSTIAYSDSSLGQTWLGIAHRPNVARTAVSARSSGMPAATNAPKTTIKMISVIGIE